jgi:phosphoserine phosphatase
MVAWMVDEIRLFRGFSEEEFVHMAEWIVSTEMWPNRRREILLELEEHRSNGNQIVLVSSGYQPIVQAFAECLNATAIGSTLDYRNGKLWDVSLPINAYEHKAKSIREKYPKFMIKAAYGDSGSDISMMELSQMPVAINPDKELRRIAKTRGWRIVPCPP